MSDNTAVRFPSHKGPRLGPERWSDFVCDRFCGAQDLRVPIRCTGVGVCVRAGSMGRLICQLAVVRCLIDVSIGAPAFALMSCRIEFLSVWARVRRRHRQSERETQRVTHSESEGDRARERKSKERERERKQTTFTSRGPSEGHAIVSDAELSMPQPAS